MAIGPSNFNLISSRSEGYFDTPSARDFVLLTLLVLSLLAIANRYKAKKKLPPVQKLILLDLRDFPVSARPLQLITFIAQRQLSEYLHALLNGRLLVKDLRDSRHAQTSCVNTAYTLLPLFVGLAKARETIKLMQIHDSRKFQITLPDQEKVFIEIDQLFDGIILRKLQDDPIFVREADEGKRKRVWDYGDAQMNEFLKVIHPHLLHLARQSQGDSKFFRFLVKKFLKEFNYSFNLDLIEKLETDIAENARRTHIFKSFIYCIGIVIEKNRFQHMFLIEQFLNPEGEINYRIYQSWAEQATLLEDLQRNHFLNSNKGMNFKELTDFFCRLKINYCPAIRLTIPSTRKVFGYKSNPDPILRFEGNRLTGLTVKYLFSDFDPTRVGANFQECFSD